MYFPAYCVFLFKVPKACNIDILLRTWQFTVQDGN
uniref:Uncharacterized protein n=1 Tax=Anguilla anguilla TaxID=7936 RepID=A0A0E9R340_ANGAN